jgi:hypothetical protein
MTKTRSVAVGFFLSGTILLGCSFAFLGDNDKPGPWRQLFDGKTTKGWRGVYATHFPDSGWKVQDGMLIHKASQGKESASGGDIVTEEEFTNFELELEFRISEGGNSGIKYFVVEREPKPAGSAIGCEFQILDDDRHPDAQKGKDGNRKAGSLYDLIPAPKDKKINPPGQWNKARVKVVGNKVEHHLNDVLTVAYDKSSEEFRKRVAESKYKIYDFFGKDEKGHILLQDHGDEVAFRNIRIRTY